MSRNLRALALFAPVLGLALMVGCPKKKSEGALDAAPAVATTTLSASESASAWPKVVPSDTVDASVEASQDGDLDAMDDAMDGETDVRAKPDTMEDVPLMGTRVFPDETPASGMRKITSNAAKVHKVPKDGTAITSLQKGTEVSLVAEYMDWYRIRYTDPATQQRRQGWIYIINMIGPRMKTCPVDWTHHNQEGGWCDRECTKNTDCKALKGYKCSGTRCFYAGD